MTSSPDWMPSVGAAEAAETIGDGLQALVGSGAMAATGTALAGTAAPFVLGTIVGPLAQTQLIEYSRRTDRRLKQFLDETDADERAYLTKLARGVCHFLPEGLDDAAIDAARGDPTELRSTMAGFYADGEGTELEETVRRLLAGDFENFDAELCEAFGTDDVYEAQALFLDFRDLVESREVQETLQRVLDIEMQLDALDDELDDTRKQLRKQFRDRDLRDEGFVRVAPVEFDYESSDPATRWRTGFDLHHVREGFAAPRDGIGGDGDDRTATAELFDALRDGADRLVVGRAGSGKSTVCKSVACEWYDDPDAGAVFYRRSGGGRPFTGAGSLVEAVGRSDGHTLVVVEDATRDGTEAVYEAMADLRGEAVSFLLDARRSDVERFEDRGGPGALETDRRGELREAFESVPRYSLPEELTVDEVEAVFERFEATTGRAATATPSRVRDELRRGGDIGQMLFLSYYLPVGGGGGGLLQDVEAKHLTITGAAEGQEHWTEITEFDPDLRRDVALMTALLVATGIGTYPELVDALETTYGRGSYEEIAEISRALEGWFVYPTDDPDAEVPATTHELWATLYLQREAEAFAEELANEDDGRRDTPDNRFRTCVTALYALADDESFREYLREGYDWSRVVDRIADDPAAFGERVALRTLELGEDRPALAPLFEFGTDRELPVPSACDPEAVSRIEDRKGHVCRKRGAYGQAREHYERCLDIERDRDDRQGIAKSLNNLGLVAEQQGDYDDANDYHQRSLSLARDLGDQDGIATGLMNLGIVARKRREYDDSRDYYEGSLDLFRDLRDQDGIAKNLNNLGIIARRQDDYDDARDYHQRSLDRFRDLGDQHSIAQSLNNLGLVAYEQGDHEEARDYHQRSLDRSRDLGDQDGIAQSLNNLGLVAEARGDYEEARGHFERAAAQYRIIGAFRGAVTAFKNLVRACEGAGDTEAAIEWCERARDWARSVERIDFSEAAEWFEEKRRELVGDGG